jgi:hypothetical protein
MNCPSEVSEIIIEIVQTGILMIRDAGWSGDAGRCALEADHIHNLPTLLKNYSPELLKSYWDVEKPSYLMRLPASEMSGTLFEMLWQRLSCYVES